MSLPGFTAEASLAYTVYSYGAEIVSGETGSRVDDRITPQLSLPLWGNYCGPGYGDTTFKKDPWDAVDAVCKAHDRCYYEHGYSNCECDKQLILSMPAAISFTWNNDYAQMVGLGAIAYFSLASCSRCAHKRVQIPYRQCYQLGWFRFCWTKYRAACVSGAGGGRGGKCDCP